MLDILPFPLECLDCFSQVINRIDKAPAAAEFDLVCKFSHGQQQIIELSRDVPVLEIALQILDTAEIDKLLRTGNQVIESVHIIDLFDFPGTLTADPVRIKQRPDLDVIVLQQADDVDEHHDCMAWSTCAICMQHNLDIRILPAHRIDIVLDLACNPQGV